jgi:hypothetical protein
MISVIITAEAFRTWARARRKKMAERVVFHLGEMRRLGNCPGMVFKACNIGA